MTSPCTDCTTLKNRLDKVLGHLKDIRKAWDAFLATSPKTQETYNEIWRMTDLCYAELDAILSEFRPGTSH